jgi:hypothetical protein
MPLLLAASKQPSAVSRAYRTSRQRNLADGGRYGKRDVDSCLQMGLDLYGPVCFSVQPHMS